VGRLTSQIKETSAKKNKQPEVPVWFGPYTKVFGVVLLLVLVVSYIRSEPSTDASQRGLEGVPVTSNSTTREPVTEETIFVIPTEQDATDATEEPSSDPVVPSETVVEETQEVTHSLTSEQYTKTLEAVDAYYTGTYERNLYYPGTFHAQHRNLAQSAEVVEVLESTELGEDELLVVVSVNLTREEETENIAYAITLRKFENTWHVYGANR